MKWKSILLYSIGLLLLLFGNTELWDKLRAENQIRKQKRETDRRNKEIVPKIQTQKVFFDSVSGKWVNQTPSFRTVHVKESKDTATVKKMSVHVETNHKAENASDTH